MSLQNTSLVRSEGVSKRNKIGDRASSEDIRVAGDGLPGLQVPPARCDAEDPDSASLNYAVYPARCSENETYELVTKHSARAYFMCENPAVVSHLMPRKFEVDGAFRAEKQRALQASQRGGRVRWVSEVDESHRARAAAAAAAATQQSQASEPRAAVPSYSIVPTRTPLMTCVSKILA
ncbi:unnamed protein product [Spodoptera exigua]|nr:unnamed protein product [Spodoptera exigua]